MFFSMISQSENATRSETDGYDNGIVAEFFFIIAVPAHTVPAIPVVVEQYSGKRLSGNSFYPLSDSGKYRIPGCRSHCEARVSISLVRISIKCGEPGLHYCFAKHPDRFLTPDNFVFQPVKEGITLGRVKKSGIKKYFSIKREPVLLLRVMHISEEFNFQERAS